MASLPPRGYEFSPEQNALFGSLAGRMRGVGLILVLLGLLNLIVAGFVIVALNKERLPKTMTDGVVNSVPEATQAALREQLSKLPPDDQMWSIALGSTINAFLYLLIGIWTRSAARSFQQVVETKGSDIGHLMEGLAALNKMYGLINFLIILGLLALIVTAGLFIYSQVAR
jgi:hypothetical protein